ncbi:ap-2 complex subunit mu [Anaeramoeba flamelloides]|uniref:Ap-2 complex subunit mu n=1 Tax=Anaeramoeba flamelloides TaxID=1746091 RepID=A0AAV7YGK5_9EUKA|nr:ap-2 complex subunit mu [Anaeramoeba flamelloides]KAJ6252906.1 ap-2 complex subunit mu [Anaeramoeba flamelloides]
MISGILFINELGKVLISRIYRQDITISFIDQFKIKVLAAKKTKNPIKHVEGTTYCFRRIGSFFIVAVTKKNINAALVFEFLNTIIEIFKGYFGEKFNENTIRTNFSLVYELLDEIIDFGYPQTTETDILKLYITRENKRQTKKSQESVKQISIKATGVIGWRQEGLKYSRNEVFLDIVENLHFLVSNSGKFLKSDVFGEIIMKSRLSGMPDCKLGLNDKVLLDKRAGGKRTKTTSSKGKNTPIVIDDVTFHQCVKLSKFDTDRSISFVPPDGEFQCASYRVTENVKKPFKVIPIVKERGAITVDVKVTIISLFSENLFAKNTVVRIPTPPNTAECVITTQTGKAKYDPQINCIVWSIKRFQGKEELSISAEVNLIRGKQSVWSRPPISLDFTIPSYTSSGLRVRYLKIVEKSITEILKWVRYLCVSKGTFQVRI